MAKLLFTENGVQLWRNFTWVRIIQPDGRVTQPMKFQGTVLLSTGTEPELKDPGDRVLELFLPALTENAVQRWFRRHRRGALVFAAGMATAVLLLSV